MTSPLPPGFMVLHSNRLEGLRDLLVQFVREHPLPPLSPDVVLVQSNGMKQWLEIALAQQLGICAATRIELPSALLWRVYRQVLGAERVPERMALDKASLGWRLMHLLPDLLEQDGFESLRHYVQADDPGTTDAMRLYQLAQQLADVYDGYQNYRSDWLHDWAQGRDVLRSAQGQRTPLPEPQRWQAALWRRLLASLPEDARLAARSQVHEAFIEILARWPEGQPLPGVPQRILVFGITALPQQTVQALAALGRFCQVLMLVHNPCQHHWGDLVDSRRPLPTGTRGRQARKPGWPLAHDPVDHSTPLSDTTRHALHTQGHPLLAAWGKQGRDYLHQLDAWDDVARYRHHFQRVDVFIDPVLEAQQQGRAPTQLEQVQSDILNLEPLPATPRPLAADDTSVVLVQTHGALREVEVLHDQILAWLDADDSLTPQDIMVMVPDMARMAAHIHAVFGRFAPGDARHVPYAVADDTPRSEPLVQALEQLLQLPQLRVTRLQWQNAFDVPALRQRFGLDEADVARIAQWLDHAAVRWGLDAEHRRPWGLHDAGDDAERNSWLQGLERLLLGYAHGTMPHEAPQAWQDTLPAPGVGGLDAPLMQGLLDWLRQVVRAQAWLAQDHTPVEWVQGLQDLVAAFFRAQSDDEARLIEQVLAPLDAWLLDCELAGLEQTLPLSVVRAHWTAQWASPALHRRFLGGGVQFATLMPMRTIPFRIVCLLGMNEADYPRRQTPRDFDLMMLDAQWRAGDRSRRDDDRYLFLEALLSARERLYVSWQGRRSTDHEPLPPSVLVAQWQDHLRRGWTPERPAVLQPLQAFSPRYFQANSGFFTYDHDWQRARTPGAPTSVSTSTATGMASVHPAGAGPASPAAAPPSELSLSSLRWVLQQPCEVFWRERLRVRWLTPQAPALEDEPFAPQGLDRYRLSQRVAQAESAEQALDLLRLGGELALGGFGQLQTQSLLRERETLRSHWDDLDARWPHPLPADSLILTLPDSAPVQHLHLSWGESAHPVWRCREDGQRLQAQWRRGNVWQGRQRRQPRLDALVELWLGHLASCASGTPTTSVLIGLDGRVTLAPLTADAAIAQWHSLVRLWLQAWHSPVPVSRQTACAWLLAQRENADADDAARAVFEGHGQQEGEWQRQLGLQRLVADFEAVRAWLPDWAPALYGPLLDAVQSQTHEEQTA